VCVCDCGMRRSALRLQCAVAHSSRRCGSSRLLGKELFPSRLLRGVGFGNSAAGGGSVGSGWQGNCGGTPAPALLFLSAWCM